MKVVKTKNCESHRFNQAYETMLVMFDGSENNVRPIGFRGNWQPTDSEAQKLVESLASISPTFAAWLVSFAETFDTWNYKPSWNSKPRTIKNLAEVLM